MRAVIHTRYGGPDVQHLEDVPVPSPAAGEILVEVHASTVNRTDCGLRSAKPFISRFFTGWRRPKYHVLGSEFAGVVAAVGADVTSFRVGNRVFGVEPTRMGGHAEYLCIAETGCVTRIPDGVSFADAAATPDGYVLANTYLQLVALPAGGRIMVYGASGSIGTSAVQIAKHLGLHVTAVTDTARLELARSLGADEVIDYTTADFTTTAATTGAPFDVVFDAVGKSSFRRCRPLLTRRGTYFVTDLGFLWQNPVLALVTRLSRGRRVGFPLPTYAKPDVEVLAKMLEAGSFRPVVDRRFPLEEIIAATEYVERGHKTGSVVIDVRPE